eukprot:UC1_evm1s1142
MVAAYLYPSQYSRIGRRLSKGLQSLLPVALKRYCATRCPRLRPVLEVVLIITIFSTIALVGKKSVDKIYEVMPDYKCFLGADVRVSGGDEPFPCDVPCFYPKNLPRANLPGNILTFNILRDKMIFSMEGEEIWDVLKLDNPSFEAHATTRFDSDIPLPYFSWDWTEYMGH